MDQLNKFKFKFNKYAAPCTTLQHTSKGGIQKYKKLQSQIQVKKDKKVNIQSANQSVNQKYKSNTKM